MIAYPLVILGVILANVAPWIGFSMIWFELIINNAMHTILFQPAKPSYNPGLITNSFLLLPYGMLTLLVATGFFTCARLGALAHPRGRDCRRARHEDPRTARRSSRSRRRTTSPSSTPTHDEGEERLR